MSLSSPPTARRLFAQRGQCRWGQGRLTCVPRTARSPGRADWGRERPGTGHGSPRGARASAQARRAWGEEPWALVPSQAPALSFVVVSKRTQLVFWLGSDV